MPRDVGALARLFPVLRRVPALDASSGPRGRAARIRSRLRRRAFAALRELLARLGARQPLVAAHRRPAVGRRRQRAVLDRYAGHRAAPAKLLLLATYRDEDSAASPLLGALDHAAPLIGDRLERLAVAPLDREQAARLVGAVLGGDPTEISTDGLIRDAEGSPFLLSELAQRRASGAGLPTAATLDDILFARVEALSSQARQLLTAAAVAGRPTALPLLASAGRVADADAAASALRAERLIAWHAGARIEPYHDRIREAVLARLAPEDLAAFHRALAGAYEAAPDPVPDVFAEHWESAGEPARAARYAELGAERRSRRSRSTRPRRRTRGAGAGRGYALGGRVAAGAPRGDALRTPGDAPRRPRPT